MFDLAALAALGRDALSQPDLSALLDEASALVTRTLDVQRCAILELAADAATPRLRASSGWPGDPRESAAMSAALAAHGACTLASPEPLCVHDLRCETRFRGAAQFRAQGIVSGLSVHIRGHDRPFGVLAAYSTRPRRFGNDEAHALEAIAAMLTLSIERLRAAEALRASNRRVHALFQHSPWGIIAYDPSGLLIEANGAALESVTPEQTARYNVLEDEHLRASGIMDDIQRAFAGEPVRLAPLYYDPARIPGTPPGRARWTRGFLYPVLDDAGAVCEVVAMIEDVTERMEAYQLLEQRVDERTREMAGLLDVAQTVSSTLELGPLLGLILDHLKAVVDYSGAAIQGLEGDVLTVLDYRGPLQRERSVGLCVRLVPGRLEDQVIRGGTPIILDDVRDTDYVGRETTMARAYQDPAPGAPPPDHVRSWLGVPLLLKERAIGMLTLVHREPGYYTPHHASLALAMAQQAAVAMENARLYQQAQALAVQEERQRLARELHDAVTQTLFSASVIAEVLPRLWERDPEAGRQRLEDVRLLTQGALAEMRTLLLELRPAALTEARLGDLLRQLVDALAGRKRLPVTLTLEGERPLPPDVQVALYRVAQEALNNAARHARASAVEVSLRFHARGVVLQIGDDGRGFAMAGVGADHFGLRIMRERVAAIGATLTVRSRPGGGTRVRVAWRDRRAHDHQGTRHGDQGDQQEERRRDRQEERP